MATQEERLAILEQRTAAQIQEINENLAMTIGLVQIQQSDIKKINQRLNDMREGVQEALSIHIDAANAHFDLLQKHADQTDKNFAEVDKNFTEVKATLAQILERLPEKP